MRPLPSPASNTPATSAFAASGEVAQRIVQGVGGDPGRARRGPFRPGQLVPSRARLDARWVARTFRVVDAAVAAGFALGLALQGHPVAAALWAVIATIGLRATGSYAFPRKQSLLRHLGGASVALAIAVGAAALPVLGSGRGDTLVVGTLAGAAAALAALQVAWWTIIARGRAQGRLTPNIVVVGATVNAQRLIEAALRTGEVNVLGVFDDRLDRAPENIMGVPVLGDTTALLDHRIMPYVDRVVIAVASTAQARVRQLVEKLDVLPNPLNLFIDVGGPAEDDAALVRIVAGNESDLTGAKAGSKRRALVKRAQDVVVASLGLLAAGPVMLLVALAVKLDSPGPIFFRQRRHGFNNEAILVWKFRSMRHEMADASAARQISANDDRVTKVGRFIRKTSLDELPQLFNVLTGEMSIVGPRPHAIGMKTAGVESAKLVAQYAHRHRMKPGLTGWAAIKGSRGPVDTPESVRVRVALDVEYIERQSFWLDLYVIAMTIPCLLGDRSAVR